MIPNIRATSNMDKRMDKENINGMMVASMMGYGRITK